MISNSELPPPSLQFDRPRPIRAMVLPQLFSRHKSKRSKSKQIQHPDLSTLTPNPTPVPSASSPPPPPPPRFPPSSPSTSSSPRHSQSTRKNPPPPPPPPYQPTAAATAPPPQPNLPRKSSTRPAHSRSSSIPSHSKSCHRPTHSSATSKGSFSSSASRPTFSRASTVHRFKKHDPDLHPLNLPPDELRRLSAMAAAADRSSMDVDSNDPRLSSSANGVNGTHAEKSPTPPPHRSNGTTAEADSFKLAGNKFFKDRNYARAIEEFSKGRRSAATVSCVLLLTNF